jgi:hypothetical protein
MTNSGLSRKKVISRHVFDCFLLVPMAGCSMTLKPVLHVIVVSDKTMLLKSYLKNGLSSRKLHVRPFPPSVSLRRVRSKEHPHIACQSACDYATTIIAPHTPSKGKPGTTSSKPRAINMFVIGGLVMTRTVLPPTRRAQFWQPSLQCPRHFRSNSSARHSPPHTHEPSQLSARACEVECLLQVRRDTNA